MRKLFTLITISLFILQNSFAQTVNLSNSIESKETGIPEKYLGSYEGNLYYSSYNMLGSVTTFAIAAKKSEVYFFKIFVYDEQGKEKPKTYLYKEETFKNLSKEKSIIFENVFLINDSLTVLYTNLAKKDDNLKLYATRISLEDPENTKAGRNTLVTEIQIDNAKDRSRIYTYKNREGTRIEFYQSPDGQKNDFVKINYGLMKGDATDIRTGSFTTKITEKESRGVLDYFISQNGTAYFVLGQYKDKSTSAIGYIHSSETDELNNFSFTSDGEEEVISSITSIELKNNKILIAEYRFNYEKSNKKNPKGILKAGIYGRIIDDNTFEETLLEPIMFDKKNFKDFDVKWPGDKNSNIKPIFFRNVELNEPILDGDNVYLTGYNFYEITRTNTKTGTSTTTGYWNGILAAKFNITKNEFEYLTTVPMLQALTYSGTFAGLGLGYFDFSALPLNNKLYIVFNDHEKNMEVKDNTKLKTYNMSASVYKLATIDEEGKKSIKYLDPGKMKEKNPILVLPTATIVEDKIVILGNNMRKKQNTIITISPKI